MAILVVMFSFHCCELNIERRTLLVPDFRLELVVELFRITTAILRDAASWCRLAEIEESIASRRADKDLEMISEGLRWLGDAGPGVDVGVEVISVISTMGSFLR